MWAQCFWWSPRQRQDHSAKHRVADFLAEDPDFIKARFHFGRFVTAAVNTEAEHAEIQALQSDMDSAARHINVS
jgi:hypothetical protein